MFKQINFLFILLALSTFTYAQDLDSCDPTSATVGDNNVLVTMVLNSDFAPPTDVDPTATAIGSYQGTSISRSGNNVTSYFDFSAAIAGIYDVSVTFPGPQGDVTFSLTNGFTIFGSGDAIIIYVDGSDGSDSNDGLTWGTAMKTLQAGIDAVSAEGFGEVWVKQGLYLPTETTDRSISFHVPAGVSIYGGFNGTETDLDQRDWINNYTELSGDIGTYLDSTDNSYHVLTAESMAKIDGFLIKYGMASGTLTNRLGGGIYLDTQSPIISNCLFEHNYAEDGGAIYVYDDSSPEIENCYFTDNKANLGGAIVCRVGGNATITDCTFIDNFAEWRGGGVFVDYGAYESSPVIISGCEFIDNYTNGNGGGFYCDDLASQYQGTYITIDNCSFTGNNAAYRGGGMSNYNENIFITITNCSFSDNVAGEGGNAIANDYAVEAEISNCTFDTNQDVDSDSTCNVTIN